MQGTLYHCVLLQTQLKHALACPRQTLAMQSNRSNVVLGLARWEVLERWPQSYITYSGHPELYILSHTSRQSQSKEGKVLLGNYLLALHFLTLLDRPMLWALQASSCHKQMVMGLRPTVRVRARWPSHRMHGPWPLRVVLDALQFPTLLNRPMLWALQASSRHKQMVMGLRSTIRLHACWHCHRMHEAWSLPLVRFETLSQPCELHERGDFLGSLVLKRSDTRFFFRRRRVNVDGKRDDGQKRLGGGVGRRRKRCRSYEPAHGVAGAVVGCRMRWWEWRASFGLLFDESGMWAFWPCLVFLVLGYLPINVPKGGSKMLRSRGCHIVTTAAAVVKNNSPWHPHLSAGGKLNLKKPWPARGKLGETKGPKLSPLSSAAERRGLNLNRAFCTQVYRSPSPGPWAAPDHCSPSHTQAHHRLRWSWSPDLDRPIGEFLISPSKNYV